MMLDLIRYISGNLITKAYAAFDFQEALNGYCDAVWGDCNASDWKGDETFLAQFVKRTGDFFAVLIAGTAVIAIIYASINLPTSAGNDQGKEEAKKILKTAIIGLILALVAEG